MEKNKEISVEKTQLKVKSINIFMHVEKLF